MFRDFVGRSMGKCIEIIQERLGRPVPDQYLDQYDLRTTHALREKLLPVKGSKEALDLIDLPMCVASSGSHAKMRTTLGLTGLMSKFGEQIFSVTAV